MKKHVFISMLMLTLAALSCSTDRDRGDLFAPGEVGILVVDATLIVGKPFPLLSLSRTVAPGEVFSAAAALVTGAQGKIAWDDQEVALIESTQPGVYGAPAPPVAPSTTYRLEIRTAEGETLRATTTTPAVFTVDEWLLIDDNDTTLRRLSTFDEYGDSLYARPENQLVYSQGILEARFPRRDEIAFQVGLFSLDPGSDFVIDPDFFSQEDFDDLDREVSSPPFDAIDGRIRLPWFAIYFEGRYLTRIYSLDRNWYDLVRSVPDLGSGGPGFGGNAGDDFERPLFHVEGGIGLFGSAAVDDIGFTIHPRD
jgi:hypothetical protein